MNPPCRTQSAHAGKKNMKNIKPKLRQKKDGLTALTAIVFAYAFMEAVGITCPIRYLTGISCAGCGMSRAWLSLLKGDVAAAFAFHPLFMLPPVALGFWLCREKLSEKMRKLLLWLLIAAFLLTYVVRLADPACSIVMADPSRGKMAEIFLYFLHQYKKP